MSLADELNWQSATELARLIRSKAVSPVELLRSCLATIERLNPKINAICTLAAESAMAAAQSAERAVMAGDEIGLLHGVPIGIKDLTPTAGIRTTFGSPLYADNVPSEDAAVVKRIKQAGAIVVGKTNTPEFGAGANTVNRLFGATHNPWDLALSVGRRPGGAACRSAGSAVSREHHLAHLASAFFPSTFTEATVVSVDGFGDFAGAAWGCGSGTSLSLDGKILFPHSLGVFYQAMTQYLGFAHYGDEYKLMGLAAYGNASCREQVKQIVSLKRDGSFALDLIFRHHLEDIAYEWPGGEPVCGTLFSQALIDTLGPPRAPEAAIEERHR